MHFLVFYLPMRWKPYRFGDKSILFHSLKKKISVRRHMATDLGQFYYIEQE